MKNIIKILALILFTETAQAKIVTVNLGTSISKVQSSDPRLRYVNEYENLRPRSLSTGISCISCFYPKLYLSATTNRLLSKEYSREMVNDKGTKFKSKEWSRTDAVMIGYQFGRLIPAFVVSNSNFQRKVYYGNTKVAEADISSIAYGASVIYLYNQNWSFTLTSIIPNEDIDSAIVFNISRNINIL
jgi:hypothetical protein